MGSGLREPHGLRQRKGGKRAGWVVGVGAAGRQCLLLSAAPGRVLMSHVSDYHKGGDRKAIPPGPVAWHQQTQPEKIKGLRACLVPYRTGNTMVVCKKTRG